MIPFVELTDWQHERLYALKGEIVRRGVGTDAELGERLQYRAQRPRRHEGLTCCDRHPAPRRSGLGGGPDQRGLARTALAPDHDDRALAGARGAPLRLVGGALGVDPFGGEAQVVRLAALAEPFAPDARSASGESRARPVGSGGPLAAGCRLGAHVTVYPNAVLYENTVVGHRTIIHAGAVVGAYGFGYDLVDGRHQLCHQLGHVEIGDDVEIGAGTTIDRGTFGRTVIGEGTKIDNLVQIGHNVIVGKHCILCSMVGISGSAELGNFVVLAGQVGVNGHIKIGDGVTATGQTGVSKDVPPGKILSGTPSREHRDEMRRSVLVNRLPALMERVKILEKNLCK